MSVTSWDVVSEESRSAYGFKAGNAVLLDHRVEPADNLLVERDAVCTSVQHLVVLDQSWIKYECVSSAHLGQLMGN